MARFFQYQHLTEPVLIEATAAAIALAVTVCDGPVFSRSIIYQAKAEPVTVSENITVDKWIEPLVEPIRIKRQPNGDVLAFVQAPSETVTVDKWFEPLGEPRRVKSRNITAGAVTAPFVPVTAVAVTTQSGWTTFPRSIIYQSTALTPFTAETVTVDKWFEPLAEPVRRKPSEARQPTAQAPFIEDAAILTKWFEPLSEPIRRKIGEARQPTAWSSFTPTAEVVTEDKWHQAWSEPIRTKRLPTSGQKSYFAPEATLPTATAVATSTNTPSVAFPRSVIYQSLAWSPYPITAPTFTYFSMVEGDTGLTFEKTIIYQVAAETPVEDIFPDKWWRPWSEPRRVRRTVHLQPALFWSGLAPAAEIITEDKWHQAWSQPVRVKARLRQYPDFFWNPSTPTATGTGVSTFALANQPVFPRSIIYQSVAWAPFFTAEVVTEDKWYQPWSEPVRRKRGLPAYEQQTFAFWPQPIITFGYYNWLSEPVRLKKGLRKDLQQTVAESPQYPNLFRIIPWFKPLEEPVRQKRGLRAWLQQFFGGGTEPIANAVTVVIDATETNNDSAQFYAVVYNRPVRCYISIKEVPRGDDAYVSMEET